MDEQVPAEPGSRRGLVLLLIVVGALVLVSAAVAVTVIFLTGRSETPALPAPAPTVCAGYLMVSVKTDAEASSTAEALRGDPQVAATFVETRDETYARFKELF